jgi:hypothetical protein
MISRNRPCRLLKSRVLARTLGMLIFLFLHHYLQSFRGPFSDFVVSFLRRVVRPTSELEDHPYSAVPVEFSTVFAEPPYLEAVSIRIPRNVTRNQTSTNHSSANEQSPDNWSQLTCKWRGESLPSETVGILHVSKQWKWTKAADHSPSDE